MNKRLSRNNRSNLGSSRRQPPRPRNTEAKRKRNSARRMRKLESLFAKWQIQARIQRALSALKSVKTWLVGTGWHTSKWASLSILACVCGAIFWLHWDDRCFIYQENVQFSNLSYLAADEIYGSTKVDTWNALWLDPEVIRQNLTRHPYVADADVQIGLMGTVAIEIQEEWPLALWVTDAGTLWLLDDGAALPARGPDDENLIQILDGSQEARALGQTETTSIDSEILASAMNLIQHIPGLKQLRYNKGKGLNFELPENQVWVYWGNGQDAETKFQNLAAAQRLLENGEATAQIIDLRYLNRPYLK